MMRKTVWALSVFFVAALLLGVCGGLRAFAQPVDVTVYCDDGYPPYSYEEEGVPKGVYVEILKVAFSRMEGFNITIEPRPYKRILKEVEEGDSFAFFPPYYLPKERPYVEPYSIPILQEEVVPVCRPEVMQAGERTRWPEDFYGLSFANNSGFRIGGDAFLQAVKDGKIRVEEARTTEMNILKTARGRVDCYINDRLSIELTIRKLRTLGLLTSEDQFVFGPPAKREMGYVGYAKKADAFPYKAVFVRKLDDVLWKMKQSGEINRIVRQFLDTASNQ